GQIDPIRYPRCLRETNKCRYQPHSGSSGEASPNAVTLRVISSRARDKSRSRKSNWPEYTALCLRIRVENSCPSGRSNCSRTGYQPTPILATPYHQQHILFSDDLHSQRGEREGRMDGVTHLRKVFRDSTENENLFAWKSEEEEEEEEEKEDSKFFTIHDKVNTKRSSIITRRDNMIENDSMKFETSTGSRSQNVLESYSVDTYDHLKYWKSIGHAVHQAIRNIRISVKKRALI
ncbi:hypothetical protein V1478_012949, partial [Vespula squamosa]